jgi:hypothetical protein
MPKLETLNSLYIYEEALNKFLDELAKKEGIVAAAITLTVIQDNEEVHLKTTTIARDEESADLAKVVHYTAIKEMLNGDAQNVEFNCASESNRCH